MAIKQNTENTIMLCTYVSFQTNFVLLSWTSLKKHTEKWLKCLTELWPETSSFSFNPLAVGCTFCYGNSCRNHLDEMCNRQPKGYTSRSKKKHLRQNLCADFVTQWDLRLKHSNLGVAFLALHTACSSENRHTTIHVVQAWCQDSLASLNAYFWSRALL